MATYSAAWTETKCALNRFSAAPKYLQRVDRFLGVKIYKNLTTLSFDRGHGIRISLADVFVMAIAAALTWAGSRHIGALTYLLPFLVGHFFMFCNVFRLRRSLELAWGATFVIHLSCWLLPTEGDPRTLLVWWIFCAIQLSFTALVIGIEIRASRYHGVLAWRINPSFRPQGRASSQKPSG